MVSEIRIPPTVHQALWIAAAAFEARGTCSGLQQIDSRSGVCCLYKALIFYCCDLAPSCGHFEFAQFK